tara:strand:- start:14334 stop:15047 length:714 start_codon:yes stop_codon:yes gene_type:complete
MTTQITYKPRMEINKREGTATNWYSKHGGPLKIWRKQGYTNSLGAHKSTSDDPCDNCSNTNYIIGKEFKMLGKNNSYASTSRDDMGCLVHNNTRGPVGTRGTGSVMSFSGNARLASATTKINPKYYVDTKAYLKSRNKNYDNKLFISQRSDIVYTISGESIMIQPTDTPLNTSMFRGRQCSNGIADVVIYKPNNSQFAVQGAVDSGSRILRLKHNTIEKGNKYSKDKSNTVCVKSKC